MAEDAIGRRALGRGLAALIGDIDPEPVAAPTSGGGQRLPLAFLRPNPHNPRRAFVEEELDALAASVREKGLLQPILVRPLGPPNAYEIIAGERRWRAAQRAGLHDVPVIVRAVGDREALEIAIVENVQRADLNALEEAAGYQRLIDEFGHSQAAVADIIGRSRPHVANTLRLLKLPEAVQAYVRDGRLSAGHARALLSLDDPATAARQIVEGGLSVRQAEELGRASPGGEAQPTRGGGSRRPGKDADTRALEKAIADSTGFVVDIEHHPDGTGTLHIRYRSLEQLDELCRRVQNG